MEIEEYKFNIEFTKFEIEIIERALVTFTDSLIKQEIEIRNEISEDECRGLVIADPNLERELDYLHSIRFHAYDLADKIEKIEDEYSTEEN